MTKQLNNEEFVKMLRESINKGTLNKWSIYSIEPVEDLEQMGIDPGMSLTTFLKNIGSDKSVFLDIKIFEKDRRETGHYRYKILLQDQDGDWLYAFDINRSENL